MSNNYPIGLFDSGVGGITVWSELITLLPQESTIYVADSYHCPYGPRKADEITALSLAIADFLTQKGCKLVVVACNTASAAALTQLRAEFSIPIVGIEPAVKPAALATKSGHIGILATEGTFEGLLFKTTSKTYAKDVMVHQQVAHGLVALIESGTLAGPALDKLLQQYLEPMLVAKVDQLVLGCTHYPFVIPAIEDLVGSQMTVINPAQAVAKQVRRLLAQNSQLATNKTVEHTFYSTGEGAVLQKLLGLVGFEGAEVMKVIL